MSDAHAHALVAHQFDDAAQQKDASSLGMWIFLVTEIMFFGGMFTAYVVYRAAYPEVFANASHHLDVLLGGINTAVLIASSLTMALAVHGAQVGNRRNLVIFLVLTLLLGLVFLGIKTVEYGAKFEHHLVPGPTFQYDGPSPRQAQLFFGLYFAMTGMHALHMVIGIAILAILIGLALKGRYTPEYYNPIEIMGLYWHFVDIVWIFLFPLLYLIGFHIHNAH
ncbi:MAG: cytochrome c oxidase subunit 3 family protein [Acidobacteriota bacterium]